MPDDVLASFCRDLRLLREQAGGPTVRALAEQVGLGKSQLDAILNGRIRRPPEWHVVRGLVEACYATARDRRRLSRLSITAGPEEYWRPRHALLEHAGDRPAPGVPTAGVPRQLPPIAPHLVGRVPELAALARAADPAAPGGPVLVTGMAGVGKTTLAVAGAHRMAHRFPDGQLYLDLHGFDPARAAMTAARAVRLFLLGLGVPPVGVPADVEARVGLYRSLLADRRVLVLLDDARDVEQVRPLLPCGPHSRAVVTSRVELTELVAADGACPLALTVLTEPDARQLLAQRIGPDRVGAEPAAVRQLIAACGGLPVALATVAARAAVRPDFPLAAIAADAGGALCAPVRDADGLDVRAVFSASYRALPAPIARLFRLLGLLPGGEVGVPAAASLAGASRSQVERQLAALARANLLSESRPGRYALHDLLRACARDTAAATEPEPERTAARRRLLDHQLHTAYRAALLTTPGRVPIVLGPAADGVRAEPLADRDEALAWFSVERDVLLATAEWAGASGHDTHAWQLAWALADLLELGGHFDDWIVLQRHAVAAARRLDDPGVLAGMLLILGNACARAGRLDEAMPPLWEALDRFRTAGDRARQARAETTIGEVLEQQGRHAEALACAHRSLALCREVGDPRGEARAENAIGWCHTQLGQHRQAVEHCERALRRYVELGDHNGLAATWDSLGRAWCGLGQHGQAVRCYREALDLTREFGDRYHEAGAFAGLADTYEAAGDPTAARHARQRAAAIYAELGHPDGARVGELLTGRS
jgi:tetratricopeptide (TPR) repeat protein